MLPANANSAAPNEHVARDREHVRSLLLRCASEAPRVEMNPHIQGGIPCIRGTRLSVGQVLGRLHVLGSIPAITDYYEGDISEDDVKDAIAFAREFLETASDPSENRS